MYTFCLKPWLYFQLVINSLCSIPLSRYFLQKVNTMVFERMICIISLPRMSEISAYGLLILYCCLVYVCWFTTYAYIVISLISNLKILFVFERIYKVQSSLEKNLIAPIQIDDLIYFGMLNCIHSIKKTEICDLFFLKK